MDKNWDFYKGKKILITGNTGFKGSWMSSLLLEAGADVTGYSLEAPTEPSMFELCGLKHEMRTVYGDIRDLDLLNRTICEVQPEFIVHMAAQPIVRESYVRPVYTYEVNVMGTVNIMECIRKNDCVRSFVNVTTDKVYENHEWEWGYRENERLNGYDPYSNSKSCSELVTACYQKSFLDGTDRNLAISTVRAGNVIGGGDFAADRIVPDCMRAAVTGKKIEVRNPNSIRPYQHVLEPVTVYLMILKKQWEDKKYAGNYNVGPDERDCLTTGQLADIFCRGWKKHTGKDLVWDSVQKGGPHEANYLKLDCSKLKHTFGWKSCWDVEMAVDKTVEWYACYHQKENLVECTRKQIEDFLKLFEQNGK